MTIWTESGGMTGRRRAALWALLGALPLLQLAYQIAAKQAAGAMASIPFSFAWITALIRTPWAQGLVVLEIVGFAAWMTVLAEIKLSAAFPLTAVSYVLVVLAGWFGFHEPMSVAQLIGGLTILRGVWMIGQGGDPEPRA